MGYSAALPPCLRRRSCDLRRGCLGEKGRGPQLPRWHIFLEKEGDGGLRLLLQWLRKTETYILYPELLNLRTKTL